MKRAFLPILLAASTWAGMTFVHPGAIESKEEIDFVKAKIASGAQPWTAKLSQLKNFAKPQADTIAPPDGDENAQKTSGKRAYANALVWAYTGEAKYADYAVAILNTWSRSFTGYAMPPVGQGNQSQLVAAWIGSLLGPAAEVLRTYPGWKPEDLAATQAMFRTNFYPILKQMSPWNGNVDLTQIDAMMSIAVFNEDEELFNLGISRLRKRDSAYFYLETDRAPARNYGGSSITSWSDANGNPPTSWVDGLTQETCRDNGHHAQFAMASALHAAEIAWHQGVDVYTESTVRFSAVMELMAKQLLTGNMQGTCTDTVTTKDFYNTWEIGYNHYANRKGIALPNTKKLITDIVRAKGASDWNIFYETLTHGDVSVPTSGIGTDRSDRSPALRLGRDGSLHLRAERTGLHEVTLLSLDGTRHQQIQLTLEAGQERNLSTGLENSPAGLHLVRVRVGTESRTFKLAR
jgi:hypothetical protein